MSSLGMAWHKSILVRSAPTVTGATGVFGSELEGDCPHAAAKNRSVAAPTGIKRLYWIISCPFPGLWLPRLRGYIFNCWVSRSQGPAVLAPAQRQAALPAVGRGV